MRLGNWWWREQEKLMKAGKRNATIAAVILSSDKTNLSVMSGGQTAYPVYITVANIDKDWRRKPSKRTTLLLGYLPTDSFEDVENDNERRRLKAELVHRSMEVMLAPLKEAMEDGVEMWCPDGRCRLVFPRIAAYLADWPELNLHCCTSIASCPVCTTLQEGRGDLDTPLDPRDRKETLDALQAYFDDGGTEILKTLGLKPVWPWWGDMKGVDLHKSIPPDMLHQLYQGIFKSHMAKWLKFFIGANELDERFAAMPRAEGLRHFPKGISVVKQWTGKESKEMLRQILPAVLGDLRPDEAQMIRSLVDFIFRAHMSSMTETDLGHLEHELDTFHQFKEVLVARDYYQSGARFDRIPKLHVLSHYVDSIREFGTPDGYSTEVPEHLHIEYAKIPWRASNKVRPLPQMLTYIQRQEAIRIHRAYLDEYLGLNQDNNVGNQGEDEEAERMGIIDECGGDDEAIDPDRELDPESLLEPIDHPDPRRHMSVTPTKQKVAVGVVVQDYQASNLTSAITDFLVRRCDVPEHDIILSPNNRLQVWHRLYLHQKPLSFAPFETPQRDVVRAIAPVRDAGGRVRTEGVWDTALYIEQPNQIRPSRGDYQDKHGLQRYRAGRVRAFFTLPGHLLEYYSGQLAYIEVFRPFEATPASPYGRMFSTAPELDARDRRRTIIVPVTEIIATCHLVPKFNQLDPGLRLDPYTDVLSIGRQFWLNHYYTHYIFLLIQHWQQRRPRPLDRLRALRR
ncbi:unnamed protein product [Rhizoctonia solani]|uniref:Uncharacterized protein n=1 Tax=Rhizoctonia solani TaxID=456999 RepID=A0A8H2WKL3_9AGAM|nr:unnamed protein product [Rhizoctonia solani]